MRADRLVAILLTLQARGQATAGELAEELEVSERTIRRDLDALLVAGVPLYSQRGRGGGWALLGGHKLNVSGLTAEEAQALTLVAGPGALGGIGLEDGARSAVRKLLAVLPEPVRAEAMLAGAAVHRDASSWGGEGPPASDEATEQPRALRDLRSAVFRGRQVEILYRRPGSDPTHRRLHPLGLVEKRGVWYLLAGTPKGLRTFRVSRIERVAVTDEAVERPDGFELKAAWDEVSGGYSERIGSMRVRLRIAPGAEERVQAILGTWVPLASLGGGEYDAGFPAVQVAALELARLGDAVEVVEPVEVRERLAEIGRALVDRYGTGTAP